MQSAVSQAVSSSGVQRVSAACIGSAGLEEPGGEAEGRTLLGNSITADEVLLDTDAYIAWAGALGGRPGIITISGTGSICLGVDANGNRQRVGGWGPRFGDEGSAYSIAAHGIREALKVLDGRSREHCFLEALLAFTGLSTSTQQTSLALTTWLYSEERSSASIAHFSRAIDKLAASGNTTAQRFFVQAGYDLTELVEAVRTQLNLEAPVRVSTGGSVLMQNSFLNQTFCAALDGNDYHYLTPSLPPVIGAVIVAASRCDSSAAFAIQRRTVTNLASLW